MISLVERLRKKHSKKRKLVNVKTVDLEKSKKLTDVHEKSRDFKVTIVKNEVTLIEGEDDSKDIQSTIDTRESIKQTKVHTNNSELVYDTVARKKPKLLNTMK